MKVTWGPSQPTPPEQWGPTDEELLQTMDEFERQQLEPVRVDRPEDMGETARDTQGAQPEAEALSDLSHRRRRVHAAAFDAQGEVIHPDTYH